jgi:hypothetical protein
MKRIIFFITALVFMAFPSVSWSTTHTAASCGYADVATKIGLAVSGDTVYVPNNGDCDWGANAITTDQAINIIGVGNPTITGSGVLWRFTTGSSTYAMRLSGFTMTGVGYYIVLTGSGSGWRIDNNNLNCSGTNCRISMLVNTEAFGNYASIDSNTFSGTGIAYGGNHLSGAISWKAAAQWGTNNAIVVENNTFTPVYIGTVNVNCIDSNNGARWIIRYNEFRDTTIQSHGACQTSIRGTRSMEIYNNIFSHPYQVWTRGYAGLRAGSNIITRNTVGGRLVTGNNCVTFDNRRSFDSACYGAGTFGACDGDNPYDMNTNPNPASGNQDGWRCMDQIGAGTQTGDMGSGGTQASDPSYVWGNTGVRVCIDGSNKYAICTSDGECPDSTCTTSNATPNVVTLVNNSSLQPVHVVADRDYYAGTEKVGWTPSTCPNPIADPSAEGSCDTDVAGTAGYTLTGGGGDETAPTLLSAYVLANGTSLQLNFDEAITPTINTGWTVTPSGGAATVAYASGTGTTTLVYTINRAIEQVETLTTSYTQPGNGLEDAAGNDLASITDRAVTNNSEQVTPPTQTLTITAVRATVTSAPSAINCTHGSAGTCENAFDTGTVVTVGGFCDQNYQTLTITGDADCSDGSVTMSAAVACTVTCTKISPDVTIGSGPAVTIGSGAAGTIY